MDGATEVESAPPGTEWQRLERYPDSALLDSLLENKFRNRPHKARVVVSTPIRHGRLVLTKLAEKAQLRMGPDATRRATERGKSLLLIIDACCS